MLISKKLYVFLISGVSKNTRIVYYGITCGGRRDFGEICCSLNTSKGSKVDFWPLTGMKKINAIIKFKYMFFVILIIK